MWELLAALQVAVEEDFARYLSDEDVTVLADRLDKLVAGIRGEIEGGGGETALLD